MNNEIVTSYVSLEVEDGTQMPSYCARPRGKGSLPSILVFQEIFGVNSHIRAVVERFASQGFMALAPELFHRTAPPGWEGDYRNYTSVLHSRALTVAHSKADLCACYQWMRHQLEVDIERMYAIGFSLGGRIAFLANATLPLHAAAASSYGGRIAPGLLDRAAAQHGPILLVWAAAIPTLQQSSGAQLAMHSRKPRSPTWRSCLQMQDTDSSAITGKTTTIRPPALVGDCLGNFLKSAIYGDVPRARPASRRNEQVRIHFDGSSGG